MEKILLDTNVFLHLLFNGKRRDKILSFIKNSDYDLYITSTILDEAIYKIALNVAFSKGMIKRKGKPMSLQIKEVMASTGYEFCWREIEEFMKIIDFYGILILESVVFFDKFFEDLRNFSVLPADIIIYHTMLANGIKKILSFDKDFDKFPEIVRLEV